MKKLFVLLVLSLTLAGCNYFNATESPIEPVPVASAMEKEYKTEAEKKPIKIETVALEKPLVTRAKLVAIGDVLLHQSVYIDAETPDGVYNFSPMFEKVKPFIESADIAVANQETTIGGVELGLSGYPMFNSPYEIADALKETGIDLVTIANNHSLDKGETGILNAIEHWDSIGMPYTGAFKSEEDREEIRTVTKNGIHFSFLSYTYGTNGLPVPADKLYLVNLIDLDLIKQDVAAARMVSDVVVVSMHWGNEYENLPNQTQIDLANELSGMGVDIIIGHHPHVLQPMDWIERGDGSRTFVMYSLGNFLSAQEGLKRLTGGIGGVEVTKTVHHGQSIIKLSNPSFMPTYGYYKNWRDFDVIPMHQLDDTFLPNYQAHYESTREHLLEFTDDITFTES